MVQLIHKDFKITAQARHRPQELGLVLELDGGAPAYYVHGDDVDVAQGSAELQFQRYSRWQHGGHPPRSLCFMALLTHLRQPQACYIHGAAADSHRHHQRFKNSGHPPEHPHPHHHQQALHRFDPRRGHENNMVCMPIMLLCTINMISIGHI